MPRSARPEVRNPLLALPAMDALRELPAESRARVRELMVQISQDARGRAERSWRKNKAPMAAYWKAVSVYSKHVARALKA